MNIRKIAVNLLGCAEIAREDGPPQATLQNKPLALLAYLATETKIHGREALSHFLWPDIPMGAARANLRKAVLRLRQAAGRMDFPLGTVETLFLDAASFRLDVAEFMSPLDSGLSREQMETRINLYRGPFLDGLALEGCPDFEDWLGVKREILHRHALGLLERLSEGHEQAGNLEKALHFANRHLELEPWDEGAHRRAMRLLATTGQTGAALAQFDFCRRVLEKELNLSPDQQTLGLFEQIKSGQIGARVSQPQPAETSPERRQVTALHCGLAVAGAGNPEDAVEHLMDAQRRACQEIRKYGGHVAQIHGGSVLGYFGYPKARENAPRDAVRAALALSRLNDESLRVRVGIHTGMTVTSADLPDAMGMTSALASQLRDGNHAVVISEETRKLVAGFFHIEPLGTEGAGKSGQAVGGRLVLGESGARHRLEAAEQLTPFVGRCGEIHTLTALWEGVKGGASHAVLIRGEAGIGKSRLAFALKERLQQEGCTFRELYCFPEFSQSPFHPLVALFETLCGFSADDGIEEKYGKLTSHVERVYPDADGEAVPLLAQLLALPAGGPPSLSPQKQKEALCMLLLDMLQILASRQPVLYLIEDLHWADPSTLELLTLFANGKNRGAILLLLTARPEFHPPWKRGISLSMELGALNDEDASAMIGAFDRNIPQDMVAHIVARADGVPLFVEEMAKMAQEGVHSIPASLQDLLAAKLDGLTGAKRTAQLAATIGREFDLDLLLKVSGPALGLAGNLDELLGSGLILAGAGKDYQFKHALIREAAYQSQTTADRRAAHRKIAEVLNEGHAGALPEILAQHWAACGETERAIASWIQAGRQAGRHLASVESIAHFKAGLQLIPHLPAGRTRDELEFSLQAGLGVALNAAQGYGSKEATQANARAAALSGSAGDGPELFQARWALTLNSIASAGTRAALGLAQELLKLTGEDPLKRQAAHYALANTAFWQGEFSSARRHASEALALYHPGQHGTQVEQYGENLSIACGAYLSWTLYFLGFPQQAQESCGRMLEQARQLAHPHSLALALCFSSVLHRWLKKDADTLRLSAETIAISRQYGFPVWLAAGEMAHGWALAMGGNEAGIGELESSIAGMRSAIRGISVVFLSALAEARLHLRQPEQALVLIEEALSDAARTGDNHFTAELCRLKSECLLRLGAGRDEAVRCLDQSLGIAVKQGAKSLELRSAMDLAVHFGERERLSSVHAWFTEGFDTAELARAGALLAG